MSINIGYEESEADEEKAAEFLLLHREKSIRSEIGAIVDDEFDRLEEYAASHLADTAKNRAEKFLEKVLDGDPQAVAQLFGVNNGSRFVEIGYDAGKPWGRLIHGSVFQTSQMELRDRLVKQYADLLRNERIADLESIVDGLKRQVVSLEKMLHERE